MRRGWGLGGAGCSALELGQVVGAPAVAGPEGLGLGGLGVPHDAGPIAEGLERDYLVVPDPERLPAAREVDVLGREPVPAWTVFSHSMGRLRKVLGR